MELNATELKYKRDSSRVETLSVKSTNPVESIYFNVRQLQQGHDNIRALVRHRHVQRCLLCLRS
jgi:hypothetical protein